MTASKGAYKMASGFVWLVGMIEGIVPLVARPLFPGDFAEAPVLRPHLRLPSPWWWIVCIAIILGAMALLGIIDGAMRRRYPDA